MYLKVGTTHFIVWPYIIWCLALRLFYPDIQYELYVSEGQYDF